MTTDSVGKLQGRTLLLRVNASQEIGTGHFMRCLALAQAWQDCAGVAFFATSEMPLILNSRLQNEKISIHKIDAVIGSEADAKQTADEARKIKADWVVVDGYMFSGEYYAALRCLGLRVLAIDDIAHQARYPVNAILNQNLSANKFAYKDKIDFSTDLLLGPKFSLQRREFRNVPRRDYRQPDETMRVLLTFGGADSENLTGLILANLIHTAKSPLRVTIAAGSLNPNISQIKETARTAPFPCEVHVDVDNMAEIMSWADVAITAAGSTIWELASMGVPSLIAATEQNQIAGLTALARVSYFRAMLAHELVSADIGQEIMRLLSSTMVKPNIEFDACGAIRVAEYLQSYN